MEEAPFLVLLDISFRICVARAHSSYVEEAPFLVVHSPYKLIRQIPATTLTSHFSLSFRISTTVHERLLPCEKPCCPVTCFPERRCLSHHLTCCGETSALVESLRSLARTLRRPVEPSPKIPDPGISISRR